MSTRVLAGFITCVLLLGCSAVVTPVHADDVTTFRILQPTADPPVVDQFPIAVAFQSVDNTPIVRFDAYVDSTFVIGGRIKNPIAAGSFQVTCDLTKTKVIPGPHTLFVKLIDSSGRVTQCQQAITVGSSKADHVPPVVRIVEPKAGTGIQGPATIRIEASDDSGIKWVMLYVNGQLRLMMNQPPFIAPWDPIKDKLAAGTYTLRVRALDVFDNETMSDPVVVRIVRPEGRTLLDTTLPAQTQDTLGVFEVSNLFQPQGGPVLPREAYANVIAPFNWLGGNLLPAPGLFAVGRQYAMPSAEGAPSGLLPPKSLPGLEGLSALVNRSLPLSPVLAWASYQLPHPAFGGRISPMATPSLLLPAEPARRTIDAGALPFIAVLPAPQKGRPAIDERSLYAVPQTTAPAQHAAPTAGQVSRPALSPAGLPTITPKTTLPERPVSRLNVTQEPVLVALVPGTMMKLIPDRTVVDVNAIPAIHLAPSRSEVIPSASATLPRPVLAVTTGASPRMTGTVLKAPVAPVHILPAPKQPATSTLPAKATPSADKAAVLPTTIRVASTAFTPNPGAHIRRPIVDTAALPTPVAIMEVQEPYTIQQGDTLEKIARAYSTTPDELAKLNPGLSPERPLPVDTSMAVPKTEARIYLDHQPLQGAAQPFIINGYSMVPFRQLVEAKDGVVIWLPQTREVNAWAHNTFMGLKIGDRNARINNETYLLPVAPSLLEERTMVPLRYLTSALNLHVEYNAASGTYYLVSR